MTAPPSCPAAVLRLPVIHDIVIGDFGRDATIEFLKRVSAGERDLILEWLDTDEHPFFDEYRRIMWTVLADIAEFKRETIAAVAKHGALTTEVLVGVGGSTSVAVEVYERVTEEALARAAFLARRGETAIRVLIPCNRLSDLAEHISARARSAEWLAGLRRRHGLDLDLDQERAVRSIRVLTVVESVTNVLKRAGCRRALVLGSAEVRALYATALGRAGIACLELNESQQREVDSSIVLAIEGTSAARTEAARRLRSDVIRPVVGPGDDVAIVEACTDFHLGVGIDSLDVFARDAVMDAYSPNSVRCSER